jgi:CHAT domain-containing protein
MSSTPDHDNAAFENYWRVIVDAGSVSTRDELLSLVCANQDALDAGALATMRLLAAGKLHMEKAFTTLDCAKAIATRQLSIRAAATRAGEQFDFVMGRPDPGHVSHYLRRKRHRTAIVSFHFIDRTRLAIIVASNAPTGSGICGFGGVYYDCLWVDGLREEFADAIEDYARSVRGQIPDFRVAGPAFDFLAAAVLQLLSRPKPEEVIFIPHKLLHALPLHTFSVDVGGGRRVYLHDTVRSIHYASSFHDLTFGDVSFSDRNSSHDRHPRFLLVLDASSDLPGVHLERKWIEVARQQLEPQGVTFDIVTKPSQLPTSHCNYLWVNWSSHAESSTNEWGDSFLMLGNQRIKASTIASQWQFDRRPTVILAACESAIDTSASNHIDEYCGLDLAFRIAGARAAIASLWPADDMVAALTTMLATSWWFQGKLPPGEAVTAIQRALRTGAWKEFLLRDDQLRQLPGDTAEAIRAVQDAFRALPNDEFRAESSWAAFRSHGD